MKTDIPTKYFLYARKSSESEDRQMASIESQIDELKKLASDLKLNVVEVLTESKTAKGPGRVVFNEMLARINSGEADGILCWKLNRLARNPIDGGLISWMLQQGKIAHIQTVGRDYKSDDNVLMMQVEFGMANQFIRDLSTDTKRGLKAKAERGWYPTNASLGYTPNPLKHKGQKEIIKDPERFDLVRKMFDLMLTGAYTPPKIRDIAVTEWGLRNRQGKMVSKSNLYRVFSDPFYYGEFEYPAKSGKWYQGMHEPMITKSEFDRIQVLLGNKHSTRPKEYDFAFRGHIKCGECGALVTAEHKLKRQKNGVVRNYIYYHCTKRKDVTCTQRSVEEKVLEEQIRQELGSIQIPEEFYSWAMSILKEQNEVEVKSRKKILFNQRFNYDDLVQKIDNLIDLRASGEIGPEDFVRRKEALTKEKEDLERLLRDTEAGTSEWLDTADRYFKFAENVQSRFSSGDLRIKKEILAMLGSNLTLENQKLNVCLPEPLKTIKLASTEVSKIHARFEPQKTHDKHGLLEQNYASSSVLLQLVKDVRTCVV